MRGCGLVLVPTTLLAMVDASLGGKTGIDFLGFKNLVGSFYPASRIVICPAAVASLPEREYLSGLAEVIKTAVIGDEELFELLEGRREQVLPARPGACRGDDPPQPCGQGTGSCEEDPWENGIRAAPESRAYLRPRAGKRNGVQRLDARGSGGLGHGQGPGGRNQPSG